MPALRDILDLPPEVKKSDFVVRLTEGVNQAQALLKNTAITPDLTGAFDRALTLVGAALRDRQSNAAYVHGSFGSGKSHFLALLSLMLGNDPAPWSEPALHQLLAKHPWVKEKKLLRLHFHMVGARGLEEKVFTEYLARIRELHPDAPIPPLFEDQALFDNAEALRTRLGDAAFFAPMNAGGAGMKGWGILGKSATWDRGTFDAARGSGEPETRARLFSVLVKVHFPAFAEASGRFVTFDRGLGILSRHAGTLGYDGVILFLDELILWLAGNAADRPFLNTEIQKLAKLVEAQDERRPVPIVSFVARQRDISEMVGDQYSGADAHALEESMRFWQGRLDTIKLEDRNLPTIVEKRVVRPKDEAGRKVLDDAFASMRRGLGQAAWGTLLADFGDEKAFRQVYPFSPALIEALVALSHYLQRERTALKVLVELLVEHLADFEIGKLVPVGDLYDVLAGGEEPMDGAMRERFAGAKRLYQNDLLPAIQAQNGTGTKEHCQRLREDHSISLGCSGCDKSRCRADNRLVKTVLLAALVPEVAVFRGLTASKLVQLNHGTLKSPVQGAEAGMAVARLRTLAAEVGKLRVDDGGDPSVRVVLEGVDLKPILEAARVQDSTGSRRRKLQDILFQALGLELGAPTVVLPVTWRGTTRTGSVHYGNVREMDDESLVAAEAHDFRLVIDYPFDDQGHSPVEDEARLVRFLDAGKQTSTVVWLPSFFSEVVQRDLGELVIIDSILEGDWKRHFQNLRPDDQSRARAELTSLGSQKRQRVLRVLSAAYGFRNAGDGEIDGSRTLERHFHVLTRGWEIRGILAAGLDRQALESTVDQLLTFRYPRHPRLGDGEKVTTGRLGKALAIYERIVDAPEQRLPIDKNELKDLEVASQLGLVSLGEASAVLNGTRLQELDKGLLAEGIETPTVARVRRLLDPTGAHGFTRDVQDFLVLAWMAGTGRELLRGGSPVREPTLGKLPDDAELVRPPMPEAAAWQRALDLSGKLFGISIGGRALNPKNLRQLAERLAAQVQDAKGKRAHLIAELLVGRSQYFEGEPARLVTARAVADLLLRVEGEDALGAVAAIAKLKPATSAEAMSKHLVEAGKTAGCLADDLVFANFEALAGRTEPDAVALLGEVRRVLEADAIREDLAPRLRDLSLRARGLVQPRGGPGPTPGPGPIPPAPPAGVTVVAEGAGSDLGSLEADLLRVRAAMDGDGSRLEFSWRVTRSKP